MGGKLLDQSRYFEMLEAARENFSVAVDYWSPKYTRGIEVLKFLNGEDHWEENERARREKDRRPCLQVQALTKFTKQVCGEMRGVKTRIKVIPGDDESDPEVAKVREGKISDIEFDSEAESVFDKVGKAQVESGFGAGRVISCYDEDFPFRQKLKIKLIKNQFSVLFDPSSDDPNFRDASFCFILGTMKKKEFEEKYPNTSTKNISGANYYYQSYRMKNTVDVVEYFVKDKESKKMALLSDGRVMEPKKAEEYLAQLKETFDQKEAEQPGSVDFSALPEIEKIGDFEREYVRWFKLSGDLQFVLEETFWPGKYIPVFMALGEERVILNESFIYGLVNDALDAQRLLDYWHTAAAELVAMQPIAPILITPKQAANFEKDYANPSGLPALFYNPSPDAPPPQRLLPGQPPTAILAEISRAEQTIKDSVGMYNATLGDQGRELSGAAINARQLPTQTTTFTFQDNLNKCVRYCGEILNDALPFFYDIESVERVRQQDGSDAFVPVNTTAGGAFEKVSKNPERFQAMNLDELKKKAKQNPYQPYNLLSKGKYRVQLTAGPSYETQRMEAADKMLNLNSIISQAISPASLVALYYTVKNMDFDGADDFAETLRKLIPYGILPPKPGEQPPAPPQPQPPTPEQILSIQLKQMELQNQKLKSFVEAERLKTERAQQVKEALKIQNEIVSGKIKINTEMAKSLDQMTQIMSQTAQETFGEQQSANEAGQV